MKHHIYRRDPLLGGNKKGPTISESRKTVPSRYMEVMAWFAYGFEVIRDDFRLHDIDIIRAHTRFDRRCAAVSPWHARGRYCFDNKLGCISGKNKLTPVCAPCVTCMSSATGRSINSTDTVVWRRRGGRCVHTVSLGAYVCNTFIQGLST